jgi:hypothetical protein
MGWISKYRSKDHHAVNKRKNEVLYHDHVLPLNAFLIPEESSCRPTVRLCRKPYNGYSCLLYGLGRIVERMKPEDGKTCVRVVCNSSLNPLDVQTARAAKWGMYREWCASLSRAA